MPANPILTAEQLAEIERNSQYGGLSAMNSAALIASHRALEAENTALKMTTTATDAAYTAGLVTGAQQVKALEARLKAAEAALTAAWELSTWAACINWRARDEDNTGEWLDELRVKIGAAQTAIEAARKGGV